MTQVAYHWSDPGFHWSQTVLLYTIYIRYKYITAQNCFVTAYGRTTTVGVLSIHMFYIFATSVPTYVHVRTDVQVYYVKIVSQYHIHHIQYI